MKVTEGSGSPFPDEFGDGRVGKNLELELDSPEGEVLAEFLGDKAVRILTGAEGPLNDVAAEALVQALLSAHPGRSKMPVTPDSCFALSELLLDTQYPVVASQRRPVTTSWGVGEGLRLEGVVYGFAAEIDGTDPSAF